MLPDRPPLLPEGARLLHIGLPKTGSTAIQAAMAAARPELLAHGVLYPGTGTRARRPAWAVLEVRHRFRETPGIDEWHALAREVREAEVPRVCISAEDFARANKARADRIVDDLGGENVHVVAVARRLDRYLSSQWQERVKHAEVRPLDAWMRFILGDPPSPAARRTWWAPQSHDVVTVMRRWVAKVGPERFTLVVGDESDRQRLPRLFEEMLGLPNGLIALNEHSNTSLTYNATELVRRVNELFVENGWSDKLYLRAVIQGLVPALQQVPRTDEDVRIPRLPADLAARVAELSARRVAAIKESGVNVVGDLDALLTDGRPDPTAGDGAPDRVSVELAARAVESALAWGRAASEKPAPRRPAPRPPAPAPAPAPWTVRRLVRGVARRAGRGAR